MVTDTSVIKDRNVAAGRVIEVRLGSVCLTKHALKALTQLQEQGVTPGQITLRIHIDTDKVPADHSTKSDPLRCADNNYIFKKDGGGWLLAFGGIPEGNWRHLKGLQRIHRLIRNKGESMDVTELVRDVDLGGAELEKNKQTAIELAGQPLPDDLTDHSQQKGVSIKQLRAGIKVLDERIADAKNNYDACTDPDRRDDLLTDLRDLRERRGRITDKLESPELKRSRNAYNAVRKSIALESIPEIQKRIPMLAQHLKDSIFYENFKYRYVPSTNINWLLRCTSQNSTSEVGPSGVQQ
jgi:hypothetical protein